MKGPTGCGLGSGALVSRALIRFERSAVFKRTRRTISCPLPSPRCAADDDGDNGAHLNRGEDYEAEHRAQRPEEGDGEGRGRHCKHHNSD